MGPPSEHYGHRDFSQTHQIKKHGSINGSLQPRTLNTYNQTEALLARELSPPNANKMILVPKQEVAFSELPARPQDDLLSRN